MSILERVENVKKLWALLMHSCPAPDDYQMGRWVSRFTDAELEYAITRTAQKFRKAMTPVPETVARYTTGVLVNQRHATVKGNYVKANDFLKTVLPQMEPAAAGPVQNEN